MTVLQIVARKQMDGGLETSNRMPTKVQADEVNSPMLALEVENLRLTRLVAELLMKNQQLREKLLFSA